MPQLRYLDNSYGNLDTASRMGSSIGNVARSRQLLPYIQMQQMLRQQALQSQMQLNAAHEQLFRAQAARSEASRLYDMARREQIQQGMENAIGLRKAVESSFEDLPSIGVGGVSMMVDNPDRAVAGATAQMLPANSDLARQVMQLRQIGTPREAYVATQTRLPTSEPRPVIIPPQSMAVTPSAIAAAPGGAMTNTAPRLGAGTSTPDMRYADSFNRYVTGVQEARARALAGADPSAAAEINAAFDQVLKGTNMLMRAQSPAAGTNAPAATSTGLRYTIEPQP